MKMSDYLSLIAVVISILSVLLPFATGRMHAEIKEITALPTFSYATHISIFLYNASSRPLNISDAFLGNVPLYRHSHLVTTVEKDGEIIDKTLTDTFPVHLAPYSEEKIIMEFVDRTNEIIDRERPLEFKLIADRGTIHTTVILKNILQTPDKFQKWQ